MKHDKRLHMPAPLQMRLSMRSHCPYFSGRTEQRVAVDISSNPGLHDSLASAGFRRVENWVYKPVCPGCQACVAWRVDVDAFAHSRNARRIARQNVDLVRASSSLLPTFEHYELFRRYVSARHYDGEMADMGRSEFISMLSNSPIETTCVTYRDPDGRLVGCALVDAQQDGLSAVYSFFDPEHKARSLGTYMILDLIEITRERGLPWLYLGYFIDGSRKMKYKERFQPAEIFVDGRWQPYEKSRDGGTAET